MLAPIASFVAISFLAAIFGGLFPPGEWYAGLEKPAVNPPDWIFAPIWTALYVCIGVSAGLVWHRSRSRTPIGVPMAMWTLQIVLNAIWSWIFFGLNEPAWALVEIVLLWVSIAATTVLFWRVDRAAGALLLPYLAWVGFASFLNFELWRLNA